MSDQDDTSGGAGAFFSVTPGQLLMQLALRVKDYAKDAGTACAMPGEEDDCGALTVGVRCEGCARRVCVGHTFWNMAGLKVFPFCPYCVLALNEDLFEEDEDAVASP